MEFALETARLSGRLGGVLLVRQGELLRRGSAPGSGGRIIQAPRAAASR
jgi:hypothetical protein